MVYAMDHNNSVIKRLWCISNFGTSMVSRCGVPILRMNKVSLNSEGPDQTGCIGRSGPSL